jgi:hypothetical protein
LRTQNVLASFDHGGCGPTTIRRPAVTAVTSGGSVFVEFVELDCANATLQANERRLWSGLTPSRLRYWAILNGSSALVDSS